MDLEANAPDPEAIAREFPELRKAFERLRVDYINQLIAADVTDREVRDACHLAIQGLETVRLKLLAHIKAD